MLVTVTPPGGAPLTLETLEAPTWSRAEQGGYRDASIRATIPNSLKRDMRLATVVLHGQSEPVYFGHVRDIDGDVLTCQGYQTRLDDNRRGCVYVATGGGWWTIPERGDIHPDIGMGVDSSDRLEASFESGTTYSNKKNAFWYFTFPEPINACRLVAVTAGLDAAYKVVVYYTTAWGGHGSYTSAQVITTNQTTTVDISATGITGLCIQVGAVSSTTPGADKTITVAPTVYGTSVTTAAAATIATHVIEQMGLTAEVDAGAATITDLVYPANTSELGKLPELLKYGDWRFYIEGRLQGNVYVPVGCFKLRPSTPAYELVEDGETVICDLVGESAEPLASVCRVHWRDSLDRERYTDVTDTDQSHYLVSRGLTKYVDIETNVKSDAQATLAGQRYLIDGGRDQVAGTLTIEGAPNGIPACDYLPGELVRLTTRERGVVVSRIIEATYHGTHSATLTLDSSPDLAGLIARLANPSTRVSSSSRLPR